MFLSSIVAGLFVWAACGDDDNTVTTPDSDAGHDATADVAEDRAPTQVIADDSGPDDAGKVIKVQGPHDAGPESIVLDGGDVDGGIPCTADGIIEVEPNDTMDTANVMPPLSEGHPSTICGYLQALPIADAGADAGDAGDDAGDAGDAGDPIENDWLTFNITPGAFDYFVQYQADGVQILVQAGADGGVQDITASPPPTLPFHPSLPYFIRVRSKDGLPHVWRVTLFEDF